MSPTLKTEQASDLWKPVVVRALIAAAFGAVTIFWPEPSVHVMGVAGGLYFIGQAFVLRWAARESGIKDLLMLRITQQGPAVLLAAVGLIVLILHHDAVFGLFAAAALLLLGAAELTLGLRYRGWHVMSRDWILLGLVNMLTGMLMPLFIFIGAHALLGVAGGGAIITAVVMLLSGLSLRTDARNRAAGGRK